MTMIKLMDCTLRDGGNVVGKGFNAALTELMLEGLTACRVPIIELGNAGGIGAYEVAGFTEAETDQTYLDIARKYMGRGSDLGMFLNAKRYGRLSVPQPGAAAGSGAGPVRLPLQLCEEIQGCRGGKGRQSLPADCGELRHQSEEPQR